MELLSVPTSRISPQHPLSGRMRNGHTIRCAGIAGPSGVPAPMGVKTEYKDGLFEKVFMGLFARKMEKFASSGGNQRDNKNLWDWDYESFVDVSKRVMVGRSRSQQQEVVREVLLSMLPPGAPAQFRKLFPPTRWAAEFNAALTVPFFNWLVGPSEVVEVEVNGVLQKSGVHIKKCRYLENSGCVGMCVNMCKIPTQDFFTNEFGLPLTMNPKLKEDVEHGRNRITIPKNCAWHGGQDPIRTEQPEDRALQESMHGVVQTSYKLHMVQQCLNATQCEGNQHTT